ncbi:MAG: SprT family zinc-dependent metalloprotease [Bacteroidia bacterium]|nr:SprT family zinc-dependent metalloprotease [Bacteroidia bacterium]
MEIKYKIVFSRRRSISITVSPDEGVVVRAPYRASHKTIDKFVNEKAGWIKKQTESFSSLTRINKDKKYTDEELHLFMGREYTLKIFQSSQASVYLRNNAIEVSTDGTEGKVKILLERWYMTEAAKIITVKMNEIISRYRDYMFSPSDLVVRKLKSRWGSCTSKGKVTISSELVKLDERFTEYVIIHELCHLIYHNHGKEFYKLLGELFPEYKSVRKNLRKYITK